MQQRLDCYGLTADSNVSSQANAAEVALLLQQRQPQQQVVGMGGVTGTCLGNSQYPQLQQQQQQHVVQLQPAAVATVSGTGVQALSGAVGPGVSAAAAAPVVLAQQSNTAAGGCVVVAAQQQAQQQYVLVPGQQQQQYQYVLVQQQPQQQQPPGGTSAVLGTLLSEHLTLSQPAPAAANTYTVVHPQQHVVAAHQVYQQQPQQPQVQQYLGLNSGQVAYTINSLPLAAGNQAP